MFSFCQYTVRYLALLPYLGPPLLGLIAGLIDVQFAMLIDGFIVLLISVFALIFTFNQ
jgi:hypothetical protein